jgi:hypothetical protein
MPSAQHENCLIKSAYSCRILNVSYLVLLLAKDCTKYSLQSEEVQNFARYAYEPSITFFESNICSPGHIVQYGATHG